MPAFLQSLAVTLFMLVATFQISTCDQKRPFYVIGHMVNSIEEIDEFLELGSNVLETDVKFYENGSISKAHHGFPCDVGRSCKKDANLEDFLKYGRNITDPDNCGKYAGKLVMQFFDLKLRNSQNKTVSGMELAQHVLDYLWSNGNREQEVRVLVYIDKVSEVEAIEGFIEEFTYRDKLQRLEKDVGFDGGDGEFEDIRKMFEKLGIGNIWQGDGITNTFHSLQIHRNRLTNAVSIRDSNDNYAKKVFDWTVDKKSRMRYALRLGVDGMITNNPKKLLEVLNEPEFSSKFTIASLSDNPFIKA